ncbi:MAG: folylpolyglutamate synthase/dihydrofolate synthase family protein [Verrucomicrobiota bacterium]|nr:folylpolyglutamate synthase/dihydrofolate synthase family protein [Verrucomicrobiota bacterium]
MKYQDALQYLNELQLFGIKLGLKNIEKLLTELNSPHEKLKFIHVAGTNGKGSVSTLLHAALTGCGKKTAIFTSPDLITVRERIRINGKTITETAFSAVIEKISKKTKIIQKNTPDFMPTYFEALTAAALIYFAKEKVDIVIWETGMGGRLDSTNIVSPLISVITEIGLEHSEYLGNNIQEIAMEKAGIIKKNCPVVCGSKNPEAQKVILKQAKKQQSEILLRDKDFFILKTSYISLPQFCNSAIPQFQMNTQILIAEKKYTVKNNLWGTYQADNIATACAVLHILHKIKIIDNICETVKYMKNALWPARLQFLKGNILIDGAHNPNAASALVKSLKDAFPDRKWNAIVGIMNNKDYLCYLDTLQEICDSIIITAVKGRYPSSPEKIFKQIKNKYSNTKIHLEKEPEKALKVIESMRSPLITGSLYLAGEIMTILYGKDYIPPILKTDSFSTCTL